MGRRCMGGYRPPKGQQLQLSVATEAAVPQDKSHGRTARPFVRRAFPLRASALAGARSQPGPPPGGLILVD